MVFAFCQSCFNRTYFLPSFEKPFFPQNTDTFRRRGGDAIFTCHTPTFLHFFSCLASVFLRGAERRPTKTLLGTRTLFPPTRCRFRRALLACQKNLLRACPRLDPPHQRALIRRTLPAFSGPQPLLHSPLRFTFRMLKGFWKPPPHCLQR